MDDDSNIILFKENVEKLKFPYVLNALPEIDDPTTTKFVVEIV